MGLKPSYGLVSRQGVIPNSYTFDTCGPMTWTVEDCAIMLQAIAGYDPGDPASIDRPVPDYRSALIGDIRGLRVGVIRHFWEEDLPANAEVRDAMEQALLVFKDMGATIEDIRMRPMQDYSDVKIIIAESELYAVHEQDLIQRPGDFCGNFLGRCLPAVLIRASDYVQAQRERRRMLDEMKEFYDRYDVLVTAGLYGPAPALSTSQTDDLFWKNPAITTPFSVTAGPALSLCNGFSANGLPLSLQIAGRPFEEETVFRVAHAYEKATPWRDRRPDLQPMERVPPSVDTAQPPPERNKSEPVLSDEIAQVVRRAGLSLNDAQFGQICKAAPDVNARLERLRHGRPRADEPANIFHLPQPSQ